MVSEARRGWGQIAAGVVLAGFVAFQVFAGGVFERPRLALFDLYTRTLPRNHTTTPRIGASNWSLTIDGSGVADPRTFTLDDLLALPAVTKTHAIECAGNGRSFFGSQQGTPVSGSQWRLGPMSRNTSSISPRPNG